MLYYDKGIPIVIIQKTKNKRTKKKEKEEGVTRLIDAKHVTWDLTKRREEG